MLEFCKSVLGFLSTIGDFAKNLVEGIFSMLKMIPEANHLTTSIIAYMPSELAIFATAGLAICIVFQIIDR